MTSYLKNVYLALGLFKTAFRKYGGSFALMLFLGFVSGLLGGFGVGVVIPLFSLFANQQNTNPDFVTRTIQNVFSALHMPMNLYALLTLIVVLFTIKAIVVLLAKNKNERACARYEEDVRKSLFENTLKTNWSFLLNQKIGYLEKVLSSDAQRSSSIISQINNILLTMTSFVTYAAFALKIMPDITLFTIGFGILLSFVSKSIYRKTRKVSETEIRITKETSHLVNESIIGAKVIKATAAEAQVARQGHLRFGNLRKARVQLALYGSMVSAFIEPVSFLFIAIFFAASYRTPGFSIAAFFATVYLIQKMFSFIQTFQGQIQGLSALVPSLKNIVRYSEALRTEREIDAGKEQFILNRALEFKKVGFAYRGREKLLSGISFSAAKGSVLGLIGPSGSGKTTIADIILRLLEPTEGSVALDDTNAAKISLTDWRRNIGYVPQDVFLLNGTIADNIRFYDSSMSDDNIVAAAKMANIHETVRNLPEQFQTVVGDRGIKLSGGQRQRIALARALARHPQLLLLDEATSNLDNESESAIQKAIADLRGKITVIIIAHRFSTVANVDRLEILDNGRIIEEGDPKILAGTPDSYFSKMAGTP